MQSMKDAIEIFITAKRAGGVADETLRLYSASLARFARFVGRDTHPAQVTAEQIDAYIAALRQRALANNTIIAYLAPVSALYNFLARRHHLDAVPDITLPRRPVLGPRAVDLETISALLDTAYTLARGGAWRDIRNLSIVEVLLDTACRVGGLLSINTARLDLAARRATLTEKGGKLQIVRFSPGTRDNLAAYLDVAPIPASGEVFVTVYAGVRVMTGNGVRQALARLCEQAGLSPITPHQLRHTWAHTALENGVNLEVIRQKLGHSSLAVTQRYLGVGAAQVGAATDIIGDIIGFGDR